MEKCIRTDPAFVARLIQVANAGRGNQITRPVVAIKDAILVLGLPAIRNLALGFSLFDGNKTGQCRHFDFEQYWIRAVLLGNAFQIIVRETRSAPPEEAFCVGLLANIGSLALASVFPEAYGRLLEDQSSPLSVEEREIQALGLDHWEIGAELFRHWGLPDVYAQPVAKHQNKSLERLPIDSRSYRLGCALALAQTIADLILQTQLRTPEKLSELHRIGARLSLESEKLLELGQEIAATFKSWTQVLSLPWLSQMDFSWVQEAAHDNTVLTTAVADNKSQALRILLVDDEVSVRQYLTQVLAEAGYRLSVASSGSEALEMAKATPPDILVTDWIMPEFDGLQLIRVLRQEPWGDNLYTLVLTAITDEEGLIEAFDAGADDYISKPIKPRVLLARLQAATRVIRLQKETERHFQEMRDIATELSVSNKRLHELSITDVLTGCPNRRYALERLQQEWALASRHTRPLACLVVDVDWFKQINDLYGHEHGDEVLKSIANTLRSGIRTEDVVCRVGGDEFWVICPNTNHEAATRCAERLCEMVRQLGIKAGDKLCSISVGVAAIDKELSSPSALLDQADRNLYSAKRNGRAQVGSRTTLS